MSLRCHWLWGHVVWFKVWRCGGPRDCSVLRQNYSVLQSTTPVLLCTTQYYARLLCTTQNYNVLLCTTKSYASTTMYYSSTTTYYSSTTLNYKVPFQYYNVLLQYYSELQSTTPVLQKYYASTTLSYPVLPVLLRYYFETSFTLRGATRGTIPLHQILRLPRKLNRIIDPHHIWNDIYNDGATRGTLQLHQILRLPRKLNRIIDPHHIWNVIYNARSKQSHPPTSPNTAPATKSWSSRFERKLPEVLLSIERRFEDNRR